MVLIAGGVLVLAALACEEKSVASIDYEREINSFIRESLDGREIFSTDLYAQSRPFARDESSDLYYYVINDVQRTVALDIADQPRDIEPFNDVYDAVATIDDEFTGEVYRIRDNDTDLVYMLESKLQRYGYFLKLYGNGYQYHGWRFWGYSSLNYSIDGQFNSTSGRTFAATAVPITERPGGVGGFYVAVDDISKLPLGDSITFVSDFAERLMAANRDELLIPYSTAEESGRQTVGWTITAASDRLYHLITFDTPGFFRTDTISFTPLVIESTLVKTGDYVIPFAVDI